MPLQVTENSWVRLELVDESAGPESCSSRSRRSAPRWSALSSAWLTPRRTRSPAIPPRSRQGTGCFNRPVPFVTATSIARRRSRPEPSSMEVRTAEIAQTIRAGVPGSQMPPFSGLTTDQVWQLVSYVRSLSGATSTAGVGAGAGPGVRAVGDPAAGEALFSGRSGCAACHEVNGRGGIVGPDLSASGQTSTQALRQKILDPSNPPPPPGGGRGGARPLVVVARTKDGREIRGVRRNEDTFSLQMVDGSGQLHLLDKMKLAEVRYENRSLMPGDYATRLSDAELQNLVAYLAHARRAATRAKTAAAPLDGGLAYERLVQRAGGAAELAALLGRFSGDALLGPQGNHRVQRPRAAGHMGDSNAGQLDAGSDAARRGRRHVHERPARDRRRARCAHGAADLAIHAAAEGPESERKSIRSIAASPCSGTRCSSARWTRRSWRSMREPVCRCGKSPSPTRCSATASRAHRSSSRTRSSSA